MATKKNADSAFTGEQIKQAMASRIPAEFARALNLGGKYVRGVLRSQGVFVSKGGTFDDAAKTALLDELTVRARKRTAQPSA